MKVLTAVKFILSITLASSCGAFAASSRDAKLSEGDLPWEMFQFTDLDCEASLEATFSGIDNSPCIQFAGPDGAQSWIWDSTDGLVLWLWDDLECSAPRQQLANINGECFTSAIPFSTVGPAMSFMVLPVGALPPGFF
jgi:hypothetical protein